ncbi:UNVERIFIED_CONTAM: hypothetical protein PYX00_011282 [Menopon gallinae]|uniref:Uncharacterized protein n=1 Tax=Menopon gallinae TaxID=328185 RepID=A0AAW2H789_9NEOP
MSGKGGVGKSVVSAMAAMALSEKGRVILLDFDICGPSICTTLGTTMKVYKGTAGLIPASIADNLDALSMSSLIRDVDAVIWRGPKKISVLDMFFESAHDYDHVIVDTPPGLSEEHWFLRDREVKSIIVSTPQNIALSDAVVSIDFCQKNGIEILGIVENMAGLACEMCACTTNVFGSKGVERLAAQYGIRHLCSLPVDRDLIRAIDEGKLLERRGQLASYRIVQELFHCKVLEMDNGKVR